MKNKVLAALSLAGVLLSQGSVVLATEMEEVEAGSVGGTDVEQATEIALDDVNFPDDNFRAAVKYAWGQVTEMTMTGIDYSNVNSKIPNNQKAKLDDLAKITTLSSTASYTVGADGKVTVSGAPLAAADQDSGTAYPFKDLTGIEYLTGLQYLTVLNSPQLKVADLTDNESLISVTILPMQAVGTGASAKPSVGPVSVSSTFTQMDVNTKTPTVTVNPTTDTTPVAYIGSSDLYSIVLPEETSELETLIVGGASQLTQLDLSAYTSLANVALPWNELAQLNVNGCSALTVLNVTGNELNGLDLSTNSTLATLNASKNDLYEITFPSGKKLTTIDLSDNKLATLDTSGLKGVATLTLNDNRLENLDLSNNALLENLAVENNHLATLDLSENPKVVAASTVSPQFLYANVEDTGIDLASYDENFQASSGTPAVGWVANTTSVKTNVTGGSINKSGVFELDSEKTNSYLYAIGNTTIASPMRVVIVRADLMNRLYNPNSGEHFYTKDLNEKDTLVKLGWQAEGIGWVAPRENATAIPTAAGEAVFRLYNPNAGDHHYTRDSKEKDVLVRAGWNYEGVGWYSAKYHDDEEVTNGLTIVPAADNGGSAVTETTITSYSIEVYREYNPNAKEAGAHNYTTSENENDTLVALGWLDEGIGWWALK